MPLELCKAGLSLPLQYGGVTDNTELIIAIDMWDSPIDRGNGMQYVSHAFLSLARETAGSVHPAAASRQRRSPLEAAQ